MARRLSKEFFNWLNESTDGKDILDIISQYQCLSLRMNGKSLKIYFQGCKILVIHSNIKNDIECDFEPLSKSYIKKKEAQLQSIIETGISICNLQQYLDCVISLISRNNKRIRQEEKIRQEITAINNRSREATDTDFFIIDQEYGVTTNNKTSKFDLIAIKWLSTSKNRKNFSASNIEIVVFELKQGSDAIGGTSKATTNKADLKSHIKDFNDLQFDSKKLYDFKEDIINMFIQQVSLKGFFNPDIKAFKHLNKYLDPKNKKELKDIIENIPVKFGFVVSDYKSASKCLLEQIKQIPDTDDFLFATSSYMGYGLFDEFIINRKQLLEKLV